VRAIAISKTLALAIRLRSKASFHEKLDQFVRKLAAKRALVSALFQIDQF
jgi:hypothetical protein